MINSIKLFVNDNEKAIELAKIVRMKFIDSGFDVKDSDFDLGIAVGGDGSFLRMVKANNFNSNPYYVGVNAGTLGFLQDVKPNQVNSLIDEIIDNKFKVDEIGIQETDITYDGISKRFYSLNEIVVRDKNFRVIRTAVKIDNDLLENYTGDALLIATSCGSTAHNLSYGGSIVYNNFPTLQITPVGPVNSKSYRTLFNPVIIPIVPTSKGIKIIPNSDYRDYIVTIDGDNNNFENVEEISTTIKDKKIKMLRFSHYNFPQKINEKLLSN